jgi:hypothetical protein
MRNLMPLGLVFFAACSSTSNSDGVLSTPLAGAKGTVTIGTPCVPSLEEDTTFHGFSWQEVELETVPAQTSGAAVCLGDHFQGLVTCPYGQGADGGSPSGKGCETPDGKPVTGTVAPQCVNRRPADTFTWSCRCANVGGNTDDGAGYCNCPMSTTCRQLVIDLGTAMSTLGGAYCVPTSVAAVASCSAECDPTTNPCD